MCAESAPDGAGGERTFCRQSDTTGARPRFLRRVQPEPPLDWRDARNRAQVQNVTPNSCKTSPRATAHIVEMNHARAGVGVSISPLHCIYCFSITVCHLSSTTTRQHSSAARGGAGAARARRAADRAPLALPSAARLLGHEHAAMRVNRILYIAAPYDHYAQIAFVFGVQGPMNHVLYGI